MVLEGGRSTAGLVEFRSGVLESSGPACGHWKPGRPPAPVDKGDLAVAGRVGVAGVAASSLYVASGVSSSEVCDRGAGAAGSSVGVAY